MEEIEIQLYNNKETDYMIKFKLPKFKVKKKKEHPPTNKDYFVPCIIDETIFDNKKYFKVEIGSKIYP